MNVKIIYAEEWKDQTNPPEEIIKLKTMVKPETILKNVLLKSKKNHEINKLFVTQDVYLTIRESSKIHTTHIYSYPDSSRNNCIFCFESAWYRLHIDENLAD